MKYRFLLSTLLAIFCSSIHAQNNSLPIIPLPQIVTFTSGNFALPKKPVIILSGTNTQANRFAAEVINQTLKSFYNTGAVIKEGAPEKGAIVLFQYSQPQTGETDLPAGFLTEGYKMLSTKDGIIIKSLSQNGILYGSMSLVQLLEKAVNKSLPAFEITDWPDMKIRGISDDISRGQVSTLENFKKIIRSLARYKMNVYMPYLEDMIKFDAYPSIGENRGALTKNEVRELVSYAGMYGIDVVPAFQTLGHYENILSKPEFLKYAEFPGAASLNISYDSTYIFLNKMLKEIFDLFPSKYFNMGADETYDVGLGKSKALVANSSMPNALLNHYKKVYDIIKNSGRKVLMYGDIILSHPEILDSLPKDIILVDWHYRADTEYPSTKIFSRAGHDYYVSPSVWNFQTTFPTQVNAIPNIKYITRSGLLNGSTGMINSNWGDYGSETFKELVYFGYAWSAQCSWNYKASDESKFAHDFFVDFFGIDNPAIQHVYDALSTPLNQVLWNELWRHPLLPFKEPAWWESKVSPVVRISWMETTLPAVLSEIETLQPLVKKNREQLDLLKYIVKLDFFYKEKLKTQFLLQDKLAGRQVDEKTLISMIDTHIKSLKNLKPEYSALWLKYYKKENLKLVEDKFDRLTVFFQEIRSQLSSGTLRPALLSSPWIYCRLSDSSFAKSARFSKSFTLAKQPSSAQLQLLADTYAKLYINGQFVDQLYVKRSLSLYTEYQRIKFLDIAKYLKPGENSISVEAENFFPNGSAGINIIAEINDGDAVTEISTDTNWEAHSTEGSQAVEGTSAKKDYPIVIVAPDFKTKRPGWIER